jgi:hypothetical protein
MAGETLAQLAGGFVIRIVPQRLLDGFERAGT